MQRIWWKERHTQEKYTICVTGIRLLYLVGFFLHSVRPRFILSLSLESLSKCKNWRESSCFCFDGADADPFIALCSGIISESVGSMLERESTMSSCWHSLLQSRVIVCSSWESMISWGMLCHGEKMLRTTMADKLWVVLVIPGQSQSVGADLHSRYR